jgi:hypothetical protein
MDPTPERAGWNKLGFAMKGPRQEIGWTTQTV